jgi:hypothetical protein
VNYALEVLSARQRRDAAIEQAKAEARETIADATARRDQAARRLRADGLSVQAIANRIGCSHGQVYEVLHPDKRERYNARRRMHWRVYNGGKAA